MMVHACYMTLWKQKQEAHTFEAGLGYIVKRWGVGVSGVAKSTRLNSQAYVDWD